MIIRDPVDGETLVVGQTDHSRLVGQLAAHWGNAEVARPEPWESVVRAAVYHDYGWLSYEASPLVDAESGDPYRFLGLPLEQRQLESYQWCIDWMAKIDLYSALIISRHRTGLWKARYGSMQHPRGKYDLHKLDPRIVRLIERNEAWQEETLKSLDERARESFPANYRLMQVWDLLGLYFCCQEPYDDYVEPVPTSYGESSEAGLRLTMSAVGGQKVAFDPYPFDVRPCHVQLTCKRLPSRSFPSSEAFKRAYFQAGTQV